jgi:hypothetical protein
MARVERAQSGGASKPDATFIDGQFIAVSALHVVVNDDVSTHSSLTPPAFYIPRGNATIHGVCYTRTGLAHRP